MSARPRRVLFVCTGNSARSILAEALANHLGSGRLVGLSAGSHPRGEVHPRAIESLRTHGLPTTGLHSKSWEEFAGPTASPLDLVITVCDKAAGEPCPAWPGGPATEHWSIADPAAATSSPEMQLKAFETAWSELETRIRALLARPDIVPGGAKPG